MVYNPFAKIWSPPPVEVREKVMMFRPGYTCVARGKLKQLGNAEQVDIRESLLGNSIHAGVLACILAPVLKQWGYIDALPDPSALGCESYLSVGTPGPDQQPDDMCWVCTDRCFGGPPEPKMIPSISVYYML